MSRSGYSDDYESNLINLWRGTVARATKGKRGQDFLKELLTAMDEMPVKRLIKNELISATGECCTIGVVCKKREVNVEDVDLEDAEEVGAIVGIARALAAEIEYHNDEAGPSNETPEERWVRMRSWVVDQINNEE
jgi:hypothetical protein